MRYKYILKWSHDDMTLSNGEHQMVFYEHDKALDEIEREIEKTKLPMAKDVIRMGVDTSEYYRIAQLEVIREGKNEVLFAASEYYLRPLFGEYAVPLIKFNGGWYRNTQEKYENKCAGMDLLTLFEATSRKYESICYGDNIIFHTPGGFVSADRNNLSDHKEMNV